MIDLAIPVQQNNWLMRKEYMTIIIIPKSSLPIGNKLENQERIISNKGFFFLDVHGNVVKFRLHKLENRKEHYTY